MGKGATATAGICLLLAGLIGCGSGGGETGGNPSRELRQWYVGVEKSVAAMERKQREFTRFQVAHPPAKSAFAELDPAGVRAGETAGEAADQLDAATALSSKEAAALYCYFFAYYVDLEFFPDEKEFEMVILNLVKTRMLPSPGAGAIRRSADQLRASMVAAEKAGGRGPEVAAAAFC